MKRRTRPLTGSTQVERQAPIAGSQNRMVEPQKASGGSGSLTRQGGVQPVCTVVQAHPQRSRWGRRELDRFNKKSAFDLEE
jgi:hypothetical protein